MKSVNRATLLGNVGKDPEVRSFSAGQVASFSLATTAKWTNKGGQKQERTEWHRVKAWSPLAEVVERYVTKGSAVYVEGEIQYSSYEAKDGTTRYTTEIVARDLVLVGGGGERKSEVVERSYSDPNPYPFPDDDSDLPF